jgi:hypothetical protein
LSAAAAGAEGDRRQPSPNRDGGDPLGRVVFAALVLACFLAFFLTQRLKHTPTPVGNIELLPVFSPSPAGRHKLEQISFKLSHAERVTVVVIDARGNPVATLMTEHPVARYKQFSLRWNGHLGPARTYAVGATAAGHPFLVPANSGALAPAGRYRIRLTLSGHATPVVSARSFTLVRG